jgi:hypothetical protein
MLLFRPSADETVSKQPDPWRRPRGADIGNDENPRLFGPNARIYGTRAGARTDVERMIHDDSAGKAGRTWHGT